MSLTELGKFWVCVFGSFAIVIWEILTQQKPFAGETPLFNSKWIFAIPIMNCSLLFLFRLFGSCFSSDFFVATQKAKPTNKNSALIFVIYSAQAQTIVVPFRSAAEKEMTMCMKNSSRVKVFTNGINNKTSFVQIILNHIYIEVAAKPLPAGGLDPSLPTIPFTMATKNRDLHICVP